MELIQFDFKNLVLSLLLFISSCGQSVYNEPVQMDLNMPKQESEERIVPTANSFNIILLSEDRWFCYTGTSIEQGKTYSHKEFQTLLDKKKKELGDNLVVLIKPTNSSSYKTTVDVLDDMTIHKIKRFALVKMSQEEEKMFPSTHDNTPEK